MKKLAFLVLLMSFASASSYAKPISFSVDPEHALPYFSFDHLGFSKVQGRFDKIEGKIILDPEAQTGSVDITIDVNSLSTGVETLDKHLLSGDFFNARMYPEATFKSTLVEFADGRPVSITGDLTVHGVTQSVTFMVTSFKRGPHPIKQNRDSLGGNARAMVSRTAFGMGRFTPNIADSVTLTIGLEAIRD